METPEDKLDGCPSCGKLICDYCSTIHELKCRKDITFVPQPFLLDATVIDEKEKCRFTISMSNDRIVIAPQGKVPFTSFLRFYQTVVETIDPNAKVVESSEFEKKMAEVEKTAFDEMAEWSKMQEKCPSVRAGPPTIPASLPGCAVTDGVCCFEDCPRRKLEAEK